MTAERLEEYRPERNRRREREVEFYRGERDRLLVLVGLATRLAARATGTSEDALFEALCRVAGTNPSRSAAVEARERRAAELRIDRLVALLRKTDPDRRAA